MGHTPLNIASIGWWCVCLGPTPSLHTIHALAICFLYPCLILVIAKKPSTLVIPVISTDQPNMPPNIQYFNKIVIPNGMHCRVAHIYIYCPPSQIYLCHYSLTLIPQRKLHRSPDDTLPLSLPLSLPHSSYSSTCKNQSIKALHPPHHPHAPSHTHDPDNPTSVPNCTWSLPSWQPCIPRDEHSDRHTNTMRRRVPDMGDPVLGRRILDVRPCRIRSIFPCRIPFRRCRFRLLPGELRSEVREYVCVGK